MRRLRQAWVVALVTCGSLLAADSRPGYRAPKSHSAVSLDAAAAAAASLPRLRSLIVKWRGELVLERYFHSGRPHRPTNIKSASKSVLSALVGIAIDRGLIESEETTITKFFPDLLNGNTDPRKRGITIEDLLTMRSGLRSTSGRNYGAWIESRNWVRYVLRGPVVSEPGHRMDYSTGSTHLLSAILTRATGTSTYSFAREVLAKPLGFSLHRWPRDPQGVYFGGNDMEMTPRQMLAFGELYLNSGRANGHQLVSEAWVQKSFVPRGRSHWSGQLYGYGWWIRNLAGYRTNYAWGYGGQFIFIVPELDLVVVTTSSPYAGPGRRGHNSKVYDLVERFIIAPIDSLTHTVPTPLAISP